MRYTPNRDIPKSGIITSNTSVPVSPRWREFSLSPSRGWRRPCFPHMVGLVSRRSPQIGQIFWDLWGRWITAARAVKSHSLSLLAAVIQRGMRFHRSRRCRCIVCPYSLRLSNEKNILISSSSWATRSRATNGGIMGGCLVKKYEILSG